MQNPRDNKTEGKIKQMQNSAVVLGKVSDCETKASVADATVRISLIDDENSSVTSAIVVSGKDGNYRAELAWNNNDELFLAIDIRSVGYMACKWPWGGPVKESTPEMRRINDGVTREIDLGLWSGFSLELILSDENGNPIPDVESMAICTSQEGHYCYWPVSNNLKIPDLKDGVSDRDGRLMIHGFPDNLSPGERFVVSLTHPEYSESLLQRPEDLERPNGMARKEIRLLKGTSVSGTVKTNNNEGIADAEVTATLDDDTANIPCCHSISKTAKSNQNGEFLIENIQPGKYSLKAKARGFQENSIKNILLPENDSDHCLTLASAARISGKILDDDGSPVKDVGVVARWVKPVRGYQSTESDDEGNYVIDSIPPKSHCEISAGSKNNKILYGFFYTKVRDQIINFDRRELVTVSGEFMDPESGEVMKSPFIVSVSVKSPSFKGWRKYARVTHSYNEKSDGSFSVSVPRGKFALTFSTAKRPNLFAELKVNVRAGKDLTGLRVAAIPKLEPKIKIVDKESGLPIEKANVNLDPENSHVGSFSSMTNAEGITCFNAGAPPYKTTITVMAEGYKKLVKKHVKLSSDPNKSKTYKLSKVRK